MENKYSELKDELSLEIEKLRLGYVNKKLLQPTELILLSTTVGTIITNIFVQSPTLGMVGGALTGVELYKLWKLFKEVNLYSAQILAELNQGRSEYDATKQAYQQFINRLAEFMKSYNFKDPLEIGLYYQILLHSGFLSVDGTFKYHVYDEDFDFHFTLDGARICSGKAVCRHMGLSLVDLYNAMGIVSSPLLVKRIEETNWLLKMPQIASILNFLPVDHLVTAVTSDKGKFIIDPTSQSVAEFGYKGNSKDNLASIVDETCSPKRQAYYINSDSYEFSKNVYGNNNYNCNSIHIAKPREFSEGEVKYAIYDAMKLYDREYANNIRTFRNDNIDLIYEIYKSEKHLSCNLEKTIVKGNSDARTKRRY